MKRANRRLRRRSDVAVSATDDFYLVGGPPEFKAAGGGADASSYSAGGPPPPIRSDCITSFNRPRSAGGMRGSSRGRATMYTGRSAATLEVKLEVASEVKIEGSASSRPRMALP